MLTFKQTLLVIALFWIVLLFALLFIGCAASPVTPTPSSGWQHGACFENPRDPRCAPAPVCQYAFPVNQAGLGRGYVVTCCTPASPGVPLCPVK